MKKTLLLSLSLSMVATQAFAQMQDEDCDPDIHRNCDSRESSIKEPNKGIYPYKPLTTSKINERLAYLTENPNFNANIWDMDRRGLTRASNSVQPWGGSFWPLFQGGIGNTYHDKDSSLFIFTPLQNLTWQQNVKDYKKRKERVHPRVYDLSEEDLAKLAPSEKYDLLLGDTSFDLTNRIWDYTEKWGEEKKWGFLSAIDMPEGYRTPKVSKMMALWEGICHGWALAAGLEPRPERPVTFTLPNGKRMPFYASDIKALTSMMWANSTIQDNVLFEGNRCNEKNPDKDKYGRYIDTTVDKMDQELTPRCADTHPAIFHVALVNVTGIEGRPIIIDHNPKLPIANQPVSSYEFNYFNPKSGKDGPLSASLISVRDYANDPYRVSRNPETTHIVGVHMNSKYVDWQLPKKHVTDSPSKDTIKDNEFNYDLEINAQGKIVGGQWRASKVVKEGRTSSKGTNQPDYFWLAPRNHREFFRPYTGLPNWPKGDVLPPKEFQTAAVVSHSFIYEESAKYNGGVSPQCKVFPSNGRGEMISVDCEFRSPKPQPLVNVVNRLLELSKN